MTGGGWLFNIIWVVISNASEKSRRFFDALHLLRMTILSFRESVSEPRNLDPSTRRNSCLVYLHSCHTERSVSGVEVSKLLLFTCEKIKILRQAQNDNVFLVRVLPLVAKGKMMRFFDAFHLLRMTILSFRA